MKLFDMPQGSQEWLSIRAGKPTGSNFSKIVTSKGEESKSRYGYALTLAAESYVGAPVDAWEGNQWTERGKELEAEAIAWYEFQSRDYVVPIGFVTDDKEQYGVSPDGLVGEDGLVEFKCLKAERHIEAILYHRKHGTCQPDYVAQTQGEIWVTERHWVDLVFYHPQLPRLVIRQEPILPVISGLATGIPLLLKERDEILVALRDGERKAA